MPKKEEQKGQAKQESTKGTKELKIVTVQVVTRDKVVKNQRQMGLLYIISALGPLHERTLQDVVKHLKDLGADLGYEFRKVGDSMYSFDVKNDVIALTYVGFVEADPSRKKYRVTGEGMEALDKHGAPPGLVKVVEENRENLKNLVALLNSQVDLQLKRRVERPGRKPFSFRPGMLR